MDKITLFPKLSKFESAWRYVCDSAAIREMPEPDLREFAKKHIEIMNAKEKLRHEWILETQMFQRVARNEEETYEFLSDYYDEHFGKKPKKAQEVIVQNMKVQVIIQNAAIEAGKARRN